MGIPGVIKMFKNASLRKKKSSKEDKILMYEFWLIVIMFGLAFLLVLFFMMLAIQLLPEFYFGIAKDTMVLCIGGSISGVAAFCAILISYAQTREIQEENRKNIRSERIDSMKPFITLEPIDLPSEGFPSAQIILSVSGSLNNRGEPVLLFEKFKSGHGWSNPQIFRFNLKNIGNNSAHNCGLTINKQKIFSGKAMAKNDSISLLTIIGENIQPTEIQFQLEFMDIGDNRYVQSHQYKGTLNGRLSDYTIITNAPKPVSGENTCDDNNLNKKS